MSLPSQNTIIEELYELRRRIKYFESIYAQMRHGEKRESWEISVNASIAELSYSLIATGVSVSGIADIVLNYAKVFTQSEYGYVSSIDPVTGDNLCHTLTGMIGDSCKIPETDKGIIFPLGPDGKYPALWGHSLNTRRAFFTNTPVSHPASVGTPKGHIPLHNFLSVPAMIGDELYGQISLANSLRDYTDHDLEAIKRFAAIYTLAIQKEMLQRKFEAEIRQHRRVEEKFQAKGSRQVLESVDSPHPDHNGSRKTKNITIKKLRNGQSPNPQELQASILANISQLFEPYLTKLQQTRLTSQQQRYIDIIRRNLEDIISPFLINIKANNVYLTPQEIQVTAMVRSGSQTKEIAKLLGISVNAVNFHRRNIRAKFGLTNQKVNLRNYLLSISDQ